LGGVPELILWDRGLEFLADVVNATCDAFKAVGIALPPFSPHLKGKVERFYRTLKAECIDHLTGLTRGPKDLRGNAYNGDEVVPFDVLLSAVREFIDRYNYERPHDGLDGQTPWAAWRADPFALRTAPSRAVFNAMLV